MILMSFNKSLVSIIMPAYNAGEYIDETVQSVLTQTWHGWELIIVNDGSVDNTIEYLEGVSDHRIKIIHQENKGVSAARNAAIKIAKGEYISFLDSDDILTRNSVESRVCFLKNNKDIDIVDGCVSICSEDLKYQLKYYEPYYNGILLPRLISLDNRVFFGIAPYMMKRHCTEGIFFNENMTNSEDLLYYTEMCNKKNIYYSYVKNKVYICRKRRRSAMSNLSNIEEGYIKYIKKIESMGLTSNEVILLKIKIAKILFLSWLSEKKIHRATRSVFAVFYSR
jgi:glycosyltransferase involved in cell wall biosynthesis